MQNLKYNHAGGIDLEYEHPVYGMIPTSTHPNDSATATLYAAAMSGDHGPIAAADPLPEPAQPSIQSQIDALERQQMLPRVTREALLATAVTLAQSAGVTESQLYAANIAYRKLKDFDTQIATLRSML